MYVPMYVMSHSISDVGSCRNKGRQTSTVERDKIYENKTEKQKK